MPPPSPGINDELLQPFLSARTEEEDDVTLSALLEIANPIVLNVLRRKILLFQPQSELRDDLNSSVIMRLIEVLRKCKQSYEKGDEKVVIRHFPALCQMVTTNIVNEHLRQKYPRRASLQNQLLYLLREAKDASSTPLFALWRDVEEQLCGLRVWEGRKLVITPRHRLLSEDCERAKQQALKGENASHLPLQRVVEAIFGWLAAPATFDALVGATARWRGVEDRADLSLSMPSSEEGEAVFEPAAVELSPEERTVLNEHLRQIWESITELPPKHRAALLLNLCDAQGRGVLGFFPSLGIASFHEIAAALEMEARVFAELWPQLPMDDREIARVYACEASVIPVWRSRARARLKKIKDEL